ncbi:sensor domain-containing diguanylate cyclase [Bacillus testis]|uniref:sensor domain-containing diguanylate cyclase n=1 Tax=Bacillus testis TaxID=1622072 RepID=UPI00067F2C44|nr:GGDEF domain-containing protein [Bacillus testis]
MEMVARNKTFIAVGLGWLAIFPAGVWLVHHLFPPAYHEINSEIFAFMLLMIIVATIPIFINDTPLFILQGISMAAFLVFGLFVELLLTQVAIMFLLIKIRIGKKELYRVPMNSLMFFFVSVGSALVYYAFGGNHGPIDVTNVNDILPVLAYSITYFIINQILLIFILVFIHKKKNNLFGADLIWELLSSVVVFPIGVILCLLYQEVQVLSVLIVAIPFISIAAIMQLYSTSVKLNEQLHKVSQIGQQLGMRQSVEQVINLFVEQVSGLFSMDHLFIFNRTKEDKLKLLRHHRKEQDENEQVCPNFSSIAQIALDKNESIRYGRKSEWSEIGQFVIGDLESLLTVPITYNNKSAGVLVLASNKKRIYERYHRNILDILATYLVIAVDNATHYEETKHISEHCALTGVYNYRYLKNRSEKVFQQLQAGSIQELSMLMIDLDHFKSVNDTYGHESGNRILCQVAAILQERAGSQGIVTRYGGEEFAILLPGMDEKLAISLGESIRQKIADTPFTVMQTLQFEQENFIRVTVSIGVATADRWQDDSLSLLRNADRAMYIGAKKAGRNRVAVYEK